MQEPRLLDEKFSNRLYWTSAIPLVFSLIYFMGLFFKRYSLSEYSLIIAAWVVFVVLYVLCIIRPKQTLIWLGLTTALMIGLSPVYGFSYCLMWNSAYFITLRFTPRTAIPLMLLVLGLIGISGYLSKTNLAFYLLVGGVPFIGLATLGFQDKRIKQEEKIKQQKNKQIEQLATIAERERIARDMHDVLGHSLTAISLKSQLAARLADAGQIEQAIKEIQQVHALCNSSLANVRQAVSHYKEKSFQQQLTSLTRQLEQAGFQVTQEVEPSELNANQESNLTLILTESVTNILRHSKGHEVKITLEKGPLKLKVLNQGKVTSYQPGNGLKGIQERAEAMGAKSRFDTSNGFLVEIAL